MKLFAETIQWRIIAILLTLGVTYFWTGSVVEATGFTAVLELVKMTSYYLWRRFVEWRRIKTEESLPVLKLSDDKLTDAINLGRGVYSPLEGFLGKEDFESVARNMRLKNGKVWPIPITLDIREDEYNRIKTKKDIALADQSSKIIALLHNVEIYKYDRKFFAENVFGTNDRAHPGVDAVYKMGKYLVGGKVELINSTDFTTDYKRYYPYPEYNFTPEQTRKVFKEKGWNSVVAFQTRNVPHRGHEFLQKAALAKTDGLFVQPVIGEKKISDFKDEYILGAYEVLLDKHYPKDKVMLGILPLKMRYAGPREAVMHALIRRNYGCTHFIVGRDHAGVGNYYGPYDAQEIFNNFDKDEIGIEVMTFPEVVYCQKQNEHVFKDAECCDSGEHLSFSGTKIREMIQNKKQPPLYLMRPEVYNLLRQSNNTFVDKMYNDPKFKEQSGFVLWFTGLSGAGKTTLANAVHDRLKEEGYRLERLDGDIVREHLSADLGFTKEDREENIRRVGFVAKMLSQNGVGVLASFISPYRHQRAKLASDMNNFIEVYCNAPLEVCEARDVKGLYAKAREGEIENFTGISHPYEHPENPHIELDTHKNSVGECADQIVNYLEENNLIK
ncbi:MAG: sulfate adenylyltransferase [Candidatus Spechtbacterales bacterium]|nr:sulfate adenylyltransferase [Candidatus Spechtbacterales bacterium]